MKIHSLKINECQRFGSHLFLDFTDEETGVPYSEIIIAGENGVGKTAILNLISQALNWIELDTQTLDNRSFIEAKYELRVSFSPKEVELFQNSSSRVMNTILKDGRGGIEELYLLEIDTLSPQGKRKSLFHALDSSGEKISVRHHNIHGLSDKDWSEYIRALYMLPEIQFSGARIMDTKSSFLDNKSASTKFALKETQSIKQLLVDVSIGDDASITQELEKIEKSKVDANSFRKSFQELKRNSRIARFKEAFNSFFENLRYIGVTNRDVNYPGEYIISFEKNGATFDIETLSSGEKQIIYRGAFLMKDAGIKRSVIALIDEPEISLHPAWQRKIVSYYSKIINENKASDNQIFIATHSPYVMQGAENACFYVLKSEESTGEQQNILAKKDARFDNWTPNQLSLDAFNLEKLHTGKASEKIERLHKMITQIESSDINHDDSEYIELETELRRLLRSDEAVLLSADLLELGNKINNL